MKKEIEFHEVEKILNKVYENEKYWFDPELINETIKATKIIVGNNNNSSLLALEFGYKQCEKGNNIEHAIIEFNKINSPHLK